MRRFVSAALVAIMLAGCSHTPAERSPIEVRVALSSDWIAWLPLILAQSRGFAQQEGVSLSIAETNGVGKGLEALLGHSVEITAGTLSQAIQVAADDRDVRCFVTLYVRSPLAVVVSPAMRGTGKISDIRDLKGRRVGIASLGSASDQFLQFLLASHGLSPRDVDAVPLGTGAPSIAALEHGMVDAAVLLGASIPAFIRKHPGVTILVDTRTPEGATAVFGTDVFPNACLLAQDSWLTTHASTAQHVARAVRNAMQWMTTHSAEDIRGAMPASMHMPDEEAELEGIRQAQHTLMPDGMMPPDAPEHLRQYVAVFSDRVRASRIDLAKTYTNTYITNSHTDITNK